LTVYKVIVGKRYLTHKTVSICDTIIINHALSAD